MRVSLLGPLQVDDVPGRVVLGAAKERSLLAALALSPGAVVTTDSLIAALWGENPPAAARKTLQTYVWNLRQSLGADVIVTQAPGYTLRIPPGDVDVGRFRALVLDGEAAMGAGNPSRASGVLGEAMALWRGEPFSGVAPHTGLAGEAVRLKEEYFSALETRVSADLAVGRHANLVGELESLVHDEPFRERLWGYLMVALYRCGRQADALATYQRARELLLEELGLEPGGELRRIEEAILNHDASLAAPARPDAPVTAAGTPSGILRSPVRYTKSSDGVSIAYQTAGDGPVDILAVPGFVTHLDIWWNAPTDGLVRRLTSIGRLISFDKRGMGLSDRPESVDAMAWVDDALAVLDAVGAKDVVVLGISAGTPTAIRLASLHPDRVAALVVFGGGARTIAGPGYEIGYDRETLERFAENLERGWGTGVAISSYAPSRAKEPHVREYWARYQQLSAGPAAAMRYFWASVETDATGLLSTISAPTLVLHPERDVVAPVEWGRYMAKRIPRAEFVALDSDIDLICVSDVIDPMAEQITAFVERTVLAPDATRDVEPALVTALAVRVGRTGRRRSAAVIERCGGALQAPGITAIFDAPGRAVRCASMIIEEAAGDEIGVGVHAGECFPTDVGYRGSAVDLAHQLAAAAAPREVLLSLAVRDLVAGGLSVERRTVTLEGRHVVVLALAPEAATAAT